MVLAHWILFLLNSCLSIRPPGLHCCIPLVCNVPTLQKVAGFMGHSGYSFCSFAGCRSMTSQTLMFGCGLDRYTWDKYVSLVSEWRDTPTDKAWDTLWKQHPIQWSELLCLPYWDIMKYAVLDVMHNLFLGDLGQHLVEIWKMNSTIVKTPKSMIPHSNEDQEKEIKKALMGIKNKSAGTLYAICHGYLCAIAHLNSLEPVGNYTKKDLIKALIDWMSDIHSEPFCVVSNCCSKKATPLVPLKCLTHGQNPSRIIQILSHN